ncbi:hypothetical protein [Flavobacterium sp.]|uniref:hypothetical protein n=1 Tax=Flavobacterium sp. TaxID=239 RepID=UPI00352905B8
MQPEKEIKLRLRFYKTSPKSIDAIMASCEKLKPDVSPDFHIKTLDNHIWLSIGARRREKHSPNLHLELDKMEDGNTAINGLFGPDPVLWTLFMFLHFVVAGIFIIFFTIAYSKWTLNQNFGLDLVIMLLMIGLWIALYFIARMLRRKGIPQMHELEDLLDKILD